MKTIALDIKRTLQRQNLASTLTADLRQRIIRGELLGGIVLRQEQIAEEYGVSRMPVREALQQLDAEGLIMNQAHRGAQVVELSQTEINEIFDLRLQLEPDILARAIPNMSPATLSKSKTLLDDLDRAYETGDVAHWGMLNADFHLSLYEPSARAVTLAFLRRINQQADRYIRLQITMTDALSDGAQEHRRMFELSRAGNAKEATALLTQHIGRTREQLLNILAPREG